MKRFGGLFVSSVFLALTACGSVDQGEDSLPPTVESPGSQEQASGSTPTVWHSVWNGASASAWFSDATSNGSLWVYENKSGKTRSAYFNLQLNSWDPNSVKCETYTYCWDPENPLSCFEEQWCYYTKYEWVYAWGDISPADFKVNANGARLATDLADSSNVYGEKCSVDYEQFLWTCEPVSMAGGIDVSWRANGLFSSTSNGVNTYSFGKYSSKNVGQYQSASADVQGSVLGVDVVTQGDFSRSLGVSVSRDIYKTP